ncbi:MAG: winged helix DNA-binding protein [Candidatus Nanohaloarchaea archaeon]|nr:winged helix DNA-binding protein [Candidatus Nanohaloarchaea archaeon]
MPEKSEYECGRCLKTFDTERGLHIHETKMHHKTGMKKTRLVVLELIKKGKKSVRSIARVMGWDEENMEKLLEKLVNKGYLEKKMVEGKKAFYNVTDKGSREIKELMKDIAEETKTFLSTIKDSFEKHLDHALPDIKVEWEED